MVWFELYRWQSLPLYLIDIPLLDNLDGSTSEVLLYMFAVQSVHPHLISSLLSVFLHSSPPPLRSLSSIMPDVIFLSLQYSKKNIQITCSLNRSLLSCVSASSLIRTDLWPSNVCTHHWLRIDILIYISIDSDYTSFFLSSVLVLPPLD
jgi:hypothetical protein